MSTLTEEKWREHITGHAKTLCLPMIRRRFNEHIDDAYEQQPSYAEFLGRLRSRRV